MNPDDVDTRLLALEGQLAGLQQQMIGLEVAPPGMRTLPPVEGETIAEWVNGMTGGSGIVVDPGLARSTPCTRVMLSAALGSIVFSPGVVGPLDDSQVALYCAEGIEDRAVTPEQTSFLSKMHRASQVCGHETAAVPDIREHVEGYYSCLARELHKQGGD